MSDRDTLSRRRLRTWLRLLRLTRSTENQLREFLRVEFDTTLPRFDVAAALFRSGRPIRMSELSQMLLVSNGNATAVVERLEKDGLAARVTGEDDRRVVLVALTEAGRSWFETLAKAHEEKVNQLFDRLGHRELDTIRDLVRHLEGKTDDRIH
ncbi:MarR family winged helix-turn-helix transcriptional regulator [Frigidibacter sp. ROC022]|uniref:MarR family winged helix-turn-helix transcriptional regulator n=1 Tax=Frigidibacter sp. ROC022 TaxID=2971796 RepID=UPI00215AE33C|nr:MarR family transcriptional regulator [Frigidibacter sp. ROC022]MCR8723180.1 MarR family transcriptional regulator [Frigidibacter sp. ROC022]